MRPGIDILLLRTMFAGAHESSVDLVSCVEVVIVVVGRGRRARLERDVPRPAWWYVRRYGMINKPRDDQM